MKPMLPIPNPESLGYKCRGGHLWQRVYDAVRCCNGFRLGPTGDDERIDAVHQILIEVPGRKPEIRPQYLSWHPIAPPAKAVA